MSDMVLHVNNNLTAISLIPAPVQVLRDNPELDNEVAREVSGSASPRFSRQRRRRAASSLPMMIRTSEPPMKLRLFTESANKSVCMFQSVWPSL